MTELTVPVTLQGVHGSLFTRKSLAALRYRRLPYRFIIGQPGIPIPAGYPDWQSLPVPKVGLLPTFYGADAGGELKAMTDSTPILAQLESLSDERSLYPTEPVIRFINYVLEDYADEWLTRCMFHYRWMYAADIDKAGAILPLLRDTGIPQAQHEKLKQFVSTRQIERLYVVGSNEVTTPVIEDSYHRFLTLMDAHLQEYPFLMGSRPGSSDFGVFGQLTCLTHFDPTPTKIVLEESPRTYAWVERLEDLSGFEVDESGWFTRDSIPDSILALLGEVARVHLPQMLANARAIAAGEKQFETEIDGKVWQQPSFPYQAKCLRWTREEFGALSDVDRESVTRLLSNVGLMPLIDEAVG
jgi:glutathione S-transferase